MPQFTTLIHGKGPEVEVEYDATPEEPRTWDHPGCDAEVEILSVRDSSNVNILEQLGDADISNLEDEAFAHLDHIHDEATLEREAARRGISL